MKKGKLSRLWICAGLLTLALLPGCGNSTSNTAVPTTATIFNDHTVVFRNGSTMTTGYNGFGQLGTGNTNQLSALTMIPSVPKSSMYATGGDHTMVAFKNNSSVWVWGSNNHGQIGDPNIATTGTSAASLVPDKIKLHGHVQWLAAGLFHSIAVVDGNIWSWGFNGYGQIGDGTFVDKQVPTALVTITNLQPNVLTNVVEVAAGTSHSLALTATGQVYAWGDNRNGQLGSDPILPLNQSSTVPVLVNLSALAPSGQFVFVDHIAAGGSTSYAVGRKVSIADGTTTYALWAWGYNGAGQLGVDPQGNLSMFTYVPAEIPLINGPDPSTITQISAGLDHLMVLAGGTVWTIGYDQFGQLGDSALIIATTITSRATLQQVFLNKKALGTALNSAVPPAVAPVTEISAFGNRSLAHVADGTTNGVWYGWGDNGFGQLGNPVPNNSVAYFTAPTLVQGF